jgi:hypothetical protein
VDLYLSGSCSINRQPCAEAGSIYGAAAASAAGAIGNWSLISLQQRLVKTDGRLVKHTRYYWLLLAEGI